MKFNKVFKHNVRMIYSYGHYSLITPDVKQSSVVAYNKAIEKGAMFDARVFNIPKEEVTNLLYWRQLDATRNSIQMVGQANFSHKELQNKSCNDIQNMLLTEKDTNWNNLPTHLKRGSCCIKNKIDLSTSSSAIIRPYWTIDTEIPIFKNEGRNYIEKLINFEKE